MTDSSFVAASRFAGLTIFDSMVIVSLSHLTKSVIPIIIAYYVASIITAIVLHKRETKQEIAKYKSLLQEVRSST